MQCPSLSKTRLDYLSSRLCWELENERCNERKAFITLDRSGDIVEDIILIVYVFTRSCYRVCPPGYRLP